MAKKKTGKSVKLKEQAVLRLLKGEDLELVSRQTGFDLHELSRCCSYDDGLQAAVSVWNGR